MGIPAYDILPNDKTVCWADTPQDLLEIPLTRNSHKNLLASILGKSRDMEWLGMDSRDAVIHAVGEAGWEAGVKRGEEAFENLDPIKLPSLRRKRRHGPVGANLDIHKVYAGRLEEAWDIMKREGQVTSNLRKTAVEILVDVGANCNYSAEQMFWRGALASMLCNVLTQSGRAVRIVAYAAFAGFADGKGSKQLTVAVPVKDWFDPLELNNLFATTALAGFFRHHIFRACCLFPYGDTNSFLGHHVDAKEEDFGPYLGDNESVRIIIDNIWSKNDAVNKMKEFRKMMEQNPNETDMTV